MYISWVFMTRNTKLSTPNNRVIAPKSTCKSIKHQVSILPHWFIPSLLPLHLVGTSNSDIRNSILLHIITVTLSHTNLHFTHTVTLVHTQRPHVSCMSWSVHRICKYIRQVVTNLYFFIFGIVIHHSH